MPLENPILSVKNVWKQFGGVWVLKNVDFDLYRGEVHALVGENGAGKSTLIKIISGVYSPDKGDVFLNGNRVTGFKVKEMEREGVFTVHQEVNLVPFLSAMENMFIGSEIVKGNLFKVISYGTMKRKAEEMIKKLGVFFDVKTPSYLLSASQQQIVQICRGLIANARVMILDEPTSALSTEEIKSLFEVVNNMKGHGVGIIFVSHKLDEILEISDRITVLKDGVKVGTIDRDEATEDKIVSMMVGESGFKAVKLEKRKSFKEVVLRIRGLWTHKLKGIDLEVKKGEIVGIVGTVGAGKTELARALFGLDKILKGEIEINGRPLKIKKPSEAIKRRIALVPEHRRLQGIFPSMPVFKNITAAYLNKWSKYGVLLISQEKEVANSFIKNLAIRTLGPLQLLRNLSGGNQQKVVLSKWLSGDFDLLILDEPTQGVDVKTKEEIYMLVKNLAERGKAILFLSSYIPEVIRISDRIITMREGKIVGEFLPDEENIEHKVMMAILSEKGGKEYASREL